MKTKRLTIRDIMKSKTNGSLPIFSMSINHPVVASIADEYLHCILVGDSMATTFYNMDSTVGLSLDTIMTHAEAIVRSTQRSLIVVDMPFSFYEESSEIAFKFASRVMIETRAQAVKLEGAYMSDTIKFLTQRGIPVMGHIGVLPQQVNQHGLGKRTNSAVLLDEAARLVDSGVFSIVLENVRDDIAEAITKSISIPTIGIGASHMCDGQIIVADDILGLTPKEKLPPFAKSHVNLADIIKSGVETYVSDVKNNFLNH